MIHSWDPLVIHPPLIVSLENSWPVPDWIYISTQSNTEMNLLLESLRYSKPTYYHLSPNIILQICNGSLENPPCFSPVNGTKARGRLQKLQGPVGVVSTKMDVVDFLHGTQYHDQEWFGLHVWQCLPVFIGVSLFGINFANLGIAWYSNFKKRSFPFLLEEKGSFTFGKTTSLDVNTTTSVTNQPRKSSN